MGLLKNGLARMGLSAQGDRLALLERYIEELELWNPRYGLVKAEDDQLIIRHILDSLSGVKTMQCLNPSLVADIGSGAGLPGIPLAIMLPHVNFHLVERSGKRAGFLRNIIICLGLKNVLVVEMSMEKLSTRYDVVMFRGFSPFRNDLMKQIKKILKDSHSTVLAYKGKKSRIQEELDTLDDNDVRDVRSIPVDVPFLDEERHLVLMHLH